MGEGGARGDLIRAAGAVLWRWAPVESGQDTDSGVEIALVHRPKYDDWSFPKGKLKSGEHVLGAVRREVEEETGAQIRLGRRLPTTTYLKQTRPKRVDYWAATAESAPADLAPNDEVDEVVWLPPEQAESRLSYARDVDLLHEFTAGPLITRPMVILRHACAGEKSEWRGNDALRPLDARGRTEAEQLTELLGVYGAMRLVSSATARCVETLLPYALATGVSVTTDPAFTVDAGTVEDARRRLDELIEDGAPAVVCTHGEIVADLVTELCRRLGEKIPDDPTLRKAGFWVAHLAVDEQTGEMTGIAALERHSARV
jgi:8-oxo-(d)GTP phosphatase